MAGGGTNSAMLNYSAYCVSKIGLIKMCELLDAEYEDLKIQIIGPGFVRTKTHYETLKAKQMAGSNYERVKEFMDSGEQGTSFEDIYRCLKWIDSSEKKVTSGRNFSVVHDSWGNEVLEAELTKNLDMYKLRRKGNAIVI
jgi:NAD(P)-dependent dehydrogenase (short-subunit alcohol dehydrogenase family)